MYHIIDLHGMFYEDALRIFIQKYNAVLKKRDQKEICVIHGYGSKRYESVDVLRTQLRQYFSRNRDKLSYRLDLNPGVTYVKPLVALEWKGKKRK